MQFYLYRVLHCFLPNTRWFHKKLSRQEAEDMLKRVQIEGSFLVRKSERDEDAFSISFR